MEKSFGISGEKSADLYRVVFYKDQWGRVLRLQTVLGENDSIGQPSGALVVHLYVEFVCIPASPMQKQDCSSGLKQTNKQTI